jgi:hypothetical protein
VSFVLLCSFAGGVEPFFLPPLEEPVVCELCVWKLLCSICIAFLCAFFAFGMAYVTLCIGILVSYIACILFHMHFVRKASLIYIIHHDVLYMIV